MGLNISLKRRLRLEERQRVADGAGGFSETWVMLGVVWADVRPRGVSVTEVSAGSTSLVRMRIYVRGAPAGDPQRPKTGQRFRLGSTIYTIDSVAEANAEGLYLQCLAHEEVLS